MDDYVLKCEECGQEAFKFGVIVLLTGSMARYFCSLKCLHSWLNSVSASDTEEEEVGGESDKSSEESVGE